MSGGYRSTRWFISVLVLLILLVVISLLSLTSGEADIPLGRIVSELRQGEGRDYFILTQIRLPRLLLAFSVGGGLSLAGAVLQGLFRNPLVEPYTLGISGGAALGVALTMVMGWHLVTGIYLLPLSGFIGSLGTIFLVTFLGLAGGSLNVNKMLLIGVMISFVASSAMMFLMSITTTENLNGIIFWIMGSLDEPNHYLIYLTFIAGMISLFVSYLFVHPLNALSLGEAKARYLGIDSRTTIRVLFIIASLLTGICVSVAGVIGFVGLVIPHVLRLIVGPDYRFLLIGSFLGGAFFLIGCDILARTLISPNELPIGVITGMLGGALFITILSRIKTGKRYGV